MTHVSAFTAIMKDSLPQMTTPQGSYEPVRYSRTTRRSASILMGGGLWSACHAGRQARVRTFLERHLMLLACSSEVDASRRHSSSHGDRSRFVEEARLGQPDRSAVSFVMTAPGTSRCASRRQPGHGVRR